MNKPINYLLAKLLKEKRFTIPTEYYFDINNIFTADKQTISEIYKANWNTKYTDRKCTKKELVSAPTISEVVMWIYEKHGIWIEVRRTNFFKEFRFQAYFNEKPLTGELGGYVSHEVPTEAYLAAIEYTLNNLI